MTEVLSPFETPGAALAAQALERVDAEALCGPKSGGRLGVALMSGVLVPLNSLLRRDNLGHLLRRSGSRGLLKCHLGRLRG